MPREHASLDLDEGILCTGTRDFVRHPVRFNSLRSERQLQRETLTWDLRHRADTDQAVPESRMHGALVLLYIVNTIVQIAEPSIPPGSVPGTGSAYTAPSIDAEPGRTRTFLKEKTEPDELVSLVFSYTSRSFLT
nr:hypothetical protein CFP56_13296 [Quercus suber]